MFDTKLYCLYMSYQLLRRNGEMVTVFPQGNVITCFLLSQPNSVRIHARVRIAVKYLHGLASEGIPHVPKLASVPRNAYNFIKNNNTSKVIWKFN